MELPNGTGTRHASAEEPHHYMTDGVLAAAMTRLELGVIRVHEAFAGWAVELHKRVSGEQVTFPEVALLNCVRFKGGSTTLSEMMVFLHRRDPAAITYSLRKLEQRSLIKRSKGRFKKEVAYSITDAGREITDQYGQQRKRYLLVLAAKIAQMHRVTNEAAVALERMISIYDEATQAVLNESVVAAASVPDVRSDEATPPRKLRRRPGRRRSK